MQRSSFDVGGHLDKDKNRGNTWHTISDDDDTPFFLRVTPGCWVQIQKEHQGETQTWCYRGSAHLGNYVTQDSFTRPRVAQGNGAWADTQKQLAGREAKKTKLRVFEPGADAVCAGAWSLRGAGGSAGAVLLSGLLVAVVGGL
jgi:hypothetical protein